MGAYVCGTASGKDIAENSLKVLVLGFCGVGKTFILYSWSYGVTNLVKIVPTDSAMFNVERIKGPVTDIPIYIWDISGKMLHRRRSYFSGSQGIVYVVDASKKAIVDALEDLQSIMTSRDLQGLPLLVLVNKVSDGETLTAADLIPLLREQVNLPATFEICDIHLYSQQDLTEALVKLEKMVLAR